MVNSEVSPPNVATNQYPVTSRTLSRSGTTIHTGLESDSDSGELVIIAWSDRDGDNEPFEWKPREIREFALQLWDLANMADKITSGVGGAV